MQGHGNLLKCTLGFQLQRWGEMPYNSANFKHIEKGIPVAHTTQYPRNTLKIAVRCVMFNLRMIALMYRDISINSLKNRMNKQTRVTFRQL